MNGARLGDRPGRLVEPQLTVLFEDARDLLDGPAHLGGLIAATVCVPALEDGLHGLR